MNRTMITATNTLAQLQKQMDIVSHNMANIDTTGYKRKEANFTDLLFQQYNNQKNQDFEAGRLTPAGIRQGVGAKLAQSQIVMKQGALKATERPLDIAFTMEGQYFRVLEQTDEGTAVRFTRDGAFYLTPISENETMLVTGDGYPVLDENNNSIIINGQAKNYKVTNNGRFIAEAANGTVQEFNLSVVQVNKPQFLEQKGGNLLGLPDGIEGEEIFTELNGALRSQIGMAQGALEQSNVDMSKEMTDLINLQRAYQFQSRSVSMADQMMGLVNGIR
ncbi:flagellar basal-body rod protein FlgG [Cytobacillus oceanisediminis]|uniref:Flagellar basal-body rod protein FlgG n=1 Tax=Cytobacillus oceanisediminis TaxID=665099 RepID=A0A2V3A4P3_9BACI|nr:flagellar hook-basal body protein [Cytobacillus oceanisediminis]PWW31227.1 flagellar basal-body rod protein FlgG [Cytobacillus oceanisediminis]